MIQEAADEDYTPIFANKGTGTAPEPTSAEANGTSAPATNGNGVEQTEAPSPLYMDA